MNHKTRAYIHLHTAVILFGFTAILGKLISLSALAIVWWRTLLCAFSLLIIINIRKKLDEIPPKIIAIYFGIGMIIALHWLAFYGSIKLCNASTALICLATTSFMTAIIEPIILKKKIHMLELSLGFVIIPAMILIVHEADYSFYKGIIYGLISAFLASIFSVLNKKYIDFASPKIITFIEMTGAFALLFVISWFVFDQSNINTWMPIQLDWLWILILAIICTTFAHILGIMALKHLSVFTTNLTINLEPIYGVLLAILILKEHKELNLQFYIGAIVICASVFSYSFLSKKYSKNV